ncbi:hypothetical protein [Saccharopolyspora gloriosae]|uniref:hypothetical protein n=1 Tax=Saccharopolyspora gloriosae TaxID=455344 RepID=UPI001FB787E2|nr:hypothetical protein [Saccharopolyspora gloriosae]
MGKAKRAMVATAMAASLASVLGGPVASAAHNAAPAQDVAPLSKCGDHGPIDIPGGRADFKLTCKGGKITITGWVLDTAANGKCVWAYGKVGNNDFKSGKACPKGKSVNFKATGKGSTAKVYLKDDG